MSYKKYLLLFSSLLLINFSYAHAQAEIPVQEILAEGYGIISPEEGSLAVINRRVKNPRSEHQIAMNLEGTFLPISSLRGRLLSNISPEDKFPMGLSMAPKEVTFYMGANVEKEETGVKVDALGLIHFRISGYESFASKSGNPRLTQELKQGSLVFIIDKVDNTFRITVNENSYLLQVQGSGDKVVDLTPHFRVKEPQAQAPAAPTEGWFTRRHHIIPAEFMRRALPQAYTPEAVDAQRRQSAAISKLQQELLGDALFTCALGDSVIIHPNGTLTYSVMALYGITAERKTVVVENVTRTIPF